MGHLVQPSCRSRVTYSRLHRTLSSQVLNISREGDSPAPLGSLGQGSVTLRGKKFFLTFSFYSNTITFKIPTLPEFSPSTGILDFQQEFFFQRRLPVPAHGARRNDPGRLWVRGGEPRTAGQEKGWAALPWEGWAAAGGNPLAAVRCRAGCCCWQCKTFRIPECMSPSVLPLWEAEKHNSSDLTTS